jgi:UDP-N-acetylmuramoylalanine--D-glutamate ligase
MENRFQDKKIGIWGFGKTGQSVLSFLSQFNAQCSVLESQAVDGFQQELLNAHNAQLVDKEFTQQFLEFNDYIIASPGVDISQYDEFQEKFITEVDLFGQQAKKPVIAVTGSAGKTSVVTLLTQLINILGKKAIAVGNIGTPLLDSIALQDDYDFIVVELSSFQLEHAKEFAPYIASIVNIYPNHLDRHKTMHAYLEAKGKLLQHQTDQQVAILPMSFMDQFWSLTRNQKITWVGDDSYANITQKLSDITCKENLQIILSILEYLNFDIENIEKHYSQLSLPKHRVEFVRTVNDVSFYNDSKSTIIDSTLNAVRKFNDKTIVLLLGGLSKGADRLALIQQLPNTVKHIICFGQEANKLAAYCAQEVFNNSYCNTLEEAVEKSVKIADKNDIVLLSPSGSSFDLFKNYEERGNTFKDLVNKL